MMITRIIAIGLMVVVVCGEKDAFALPKCEGICGENGFASVSDKARCNDSESSLPKCERIVNRKKQVVCYVCIDRVSRLAKIKARRGRLDAIQDATNENLKKRFKNGSGYIF